MIVVAAGMRDWPDKQHVFDELDLLFVEHCTDWCAKRDLALDRPLHANVKKQMHEAFVLRHGVSGNVDFAANDWGLKRGVTIERFPAEWRDPITNAFQPWAGPRRNELMASKEPRADLWLAFWDGKFQQRGGKKVSGTFDGICVSLKYGLNVAIKPPRGK